MQDSVNAKVATLENQLTECFGLLMSLTQLAELLGRSTGGLRYSLSYPSDASDARPQGLRAQDRPTNILSGVGSCPDHTR
jgi:hypothetical protein